MKEFSLGEREFIPLCDLLKLTRLCDSGGEAKSVIANGEVVVDEQVETRKRCKIRKGQIIKYAGSTIKVV